MFTLQDAVPASLTAIDDSLVLNSSALSQGEVDAATETHLYVQSVARAIAQERGLDIADPGLYKKEGWYDALGAAVAEYAGWVEITGGSDIAVNNSTQSGRINLASIMGAVMSLYLGPAAMAEWSTLNDVLGGASNPEISNFMDFWWSHVKKTATQTGLTVGPNERTSDGQTQWAICCYSMTHDIDDWRSLFVSSTYEEFDVSAKGLTLTMNTNFYRREAQADVLDYLGDDIHTKVKHAPVPKKTLMEGSAPSPAGASLRQQIRSAPRLGLGGVQVLTKDIHDVLVTDPYGDPMLNGAGIGHIDFDGNTVTQLRCGFFTQPRPVQGRQYVVSGKYDDTNLPFTFTVRCTQAGSRSYFVP